MTRSFLQNLILLIEDQYGNRGNVGKLLDTVKGETTPTAYNMEKLIAEVFGLYKDDVIGTTNEFADIEFNFAQAMSAIETSLNDFGDIGSKIMRV